MNKGALFCTLIYDHKARSFIIMLDYINDPYLNQGKEVNAIVIPIGIICVDDYLDPTDIAESPNNEPFEAPEKEKSPLN